MSRYIHDKTTHELIPVSGFGSRVATSVNGNTLKVHGSLLDIEGYNYGEGDITTAVQMIAPIESTLVASKAYAIGDQFVYEGLLYKATAAIASGAAIVIGTNASLADSVTEQISTVEVDSVSTQYGSFQIKKCGKIVSIYGYFSGMPTTSTTISLSLGTKYGSATSYAIAPFFSHSLPYAPSGSAWLFSDGTLGVYKPASETSGYTFLTYVCK